MDKKLTMNYGGNIESDKSTLLCFSIAETIRHNNTGGCFAVVALHDLKGGLCGV